MRCKLSSLQEQPPSQKKPQVNAKRDFAAVVVSETRRSPFFQQGHMKGFAVEEALLLAGISMTKDIMLGEVS